VIQHTRSMIHLTYRVKNRASSRSLASPYSDTSDVARVHRRCASVSVRVCPFASNGHYASFIACVCAYTRARARTGKSRNRARVYGSFPRAQAWVHNGYISMEERKDAPHRSTNELNSCAGYARCNGV